MSLSLSSAELGLNSDAELVSQIPSWFRGHPVTISQPNGQVRKVVGSRVRLEYKANTIEPLELVLYIAIPYA